MHMRMHTRMHMRMHTRMHMRARAYMHMCIRRYSPVLDVRGLGAGRRFSAAITWAGEVWVWGELGGRVLPKPLLLERLESATVVAITCGADHIAILTGEPAMLQARPQTCASI